MFVHEALMEAPVIPAVVGGPAAEWLALRLARPSGGDGRFRGTTGPRAPGAYRVSAIERYLACPFKYFAAHVLRAEEERAEEPGLSALERGRLVHEVFEAFFTEWQAAGRGAITPESLAEAIDTFGRVAEARLETLPEADRALERAQLLGSAAASGFGARAFEFEIESGAAVVERLLEHALEGPFVVDGGDGPREVALRGKADRIDLLEDGTLRLVDYKLGHAPKPARAIQLPVYGVCAEQRLRGRHGRDWTFGAAGYVAFGERQPFVAMGGRTRFADAVTEGIGRLLAAVDGIERGEFPVRPDEPFLCTYCAYPSVCRKDYVGDE
jgi:RecB family exonuclease